MSQLGEKPIHETVQLRAPLGLRARRVSLRGDERADASSRFENAGTLEIRLYLRDRVRVHSQLDRELTDGRELVPLVQPARGDGRPDGALELRVNRRFVGLIEREAFPGAHET